MLTIACQGAGMFIDPKILADNVPDDASLLAMKAALRELKMTMRKFRKTDQIFVYIRLTYI